MTANNKRSPKKAIPTPILIVALILLGLTVFVLPYQVFRYFEIRAFSLYDSLNESVLADLPAPEGVTQLELTQGGGHGGEHGRYIRIEYRRTSITADDVSAYYRQLLLGTGWSRYLPEAVSRGTTWYIRGTACIELNIFTPPQYPFATDEYTVWIWHDFAGQEFSPPMPDLRLVELFEFGTTDILTCPP